MVVNMSLAYISLQNVRSSLAMYLSTSLAVVLACNTYEVGLGQVQPAQEISQSQLPLQSQGIEAIPAEPTVEKLDEPKISESPAVPRSKEPLRVKALQTPNTSIVGIGTGTTPEDATEGRLPPPMPLPFGPDREAGWSVKTKHWVAPAYCHLPTYYEDVMLEAHGHERCPPVQPILSGARFYTGIFFTPYLSYMRPPLKDIPSTGHYRPGSCAPAIRQRAPYDAGAIKVQAAATATGVLALQP
jgi:hypothetical protein